MQNVYAIMYGTLLNEKLRDTVLPVYVPFN